MQFQSLRIFVAAFLALAGLLPFGLGAWAMQDQSPRLLETGKPIERELAGGQAHSYQLTLAAGQYLCLVVEQRGIDVVVTLFEPDGKKLVEVDSPNGTQGPEPVSLIVEVSGNYRLEVRSLEEDAKAGRYEVKVQGIREATAQDKSRVAAERVFMEGGQLEAQKTTASLRGAVSKYEESLPLWQAAGDRYQEARTLHLIGDFYNSWGDGQMALNYFYRALPLRHTVGDHSGEVATLNMIGLVYQSLGERRKSLDFYHQALPITRANNDRDYEAVILNNIGLAYRSLGETQKALDCYYQALPLRRAVGDRDGEAVTLNNIGVAYSSLGDNQRALDYYHQSLSVSHAAGNRIDEANTLDNIGVVTASMGDEQKAITFYSEALKIARDIGDRRTEANVLDDIGKAYGRLGEIHKALDYFNQALPLRRATGNRDGEAETLNNIGSVYRALGEPQKAFEYYSQALPLRRIVEDRHGEVRTLYEIARIERDRNYLTEARSLSEAALNITESLRTKIVGHEFRASYFATVRKHYEFHTDLLMQMHKRRAYDGNDAAALQTSERARARNLLELLTEARTDIRQGVDPALLERERSLQQLLNAKAERQTRLLSGKHTEEQAKAAAKEIETLTTQFQEVQAQIRATSPRYAALTQPQPLTLKEIQQQALDADTLLLEYALGDERSYLWAVTPTSIASHELPKRAEVKAAASRFYDLAKTGAQSEEAAKAAFALSRMLLSPVAAQLRTKRLVIVADGALQYVPFAALPEPQATGTGYQPLIVAHEIVSLPSASTLAVLRRETAGRAQAAKTVAVLADPVFASDDVRVKRAKAEAQANAAQQVASADGPRAVERPVEKALRDTGGGTLARLINSRREAAGILALAPESARKQATDFAANRATATSEELGQYRYVHFATHGLLDSAHPELSGVVLSLVDERGQPQDGFLRLHDIYNLKLPVELVVLSACQTALGKDIKGEGLVGLTRGFMYAGAPRVVASLWKVDDKATAELMKLFYQGMLGKEKLRPAEALRTAQVAMWKQKRWQSPYYWAAFVMQGEWK